MACTVKAESIAGLWLDEWGVRVNEGQSPPMESYPELWTATSIFWSQKCHLYSTNHIEGSAANQMDGKAPCVHPVWAGTVEVITPMTLPKTKSGTVPLTGLLNGSLFFWGQKGSPLFSCLAWLWWELDLVVSLVIKVPEGMASCPVVLPIAIGSISMATLSFLFQ